MWQLATISESVLKQQSSFILTSCNETALSDCQKEQNALNLLCSKCFEPTKQTSLFQLLRGKGKIFGMFCHGAGIRGFQFAHQLWGTLPERYGQCAEARNTGMKNLCKHNRDSAAKQKAAPPQLSSGEGS